MAGEEDDDGLISATPGQEKAWAEVAHTMGYSDFHRLDRCECGGVCDCWTKKYSEEERKGNGYPDAHFRSEWICERCGDVSDKYYDAQMQEITR